MKSTEEYVVLVDNKNNQLGVELKSRVHTANTPMHRAFSLFIFNHKGQLLLQQRAHSKQTWPGVWSNSVCGHPLPKESFIAAARRRARYELGLSIPANELLTVLPGYTYRYEHKGVVEHEFCPVLVAKSTEEVAPNPAEVANTRWIDWADFVAETKQSNTYSEWCVEETQLLNTNPEFQQLYKGLGQ